MPEPKDEVLSILKQCHAKLVRTKRHRVWRFPDGRIFTQSSSPSDVNADRQQLRDLRRMKSRYGF